jgi:hypothetical protein
MNDITREFAKQAGFYKYGDDFEDIIDKFAELIVNECAELMKKESEEYYNVGDDYCDHKANAFDEAVNLVKKHFGVA